MWASSLLSYTATDIAKCLSPVHLPSHNRQYAKAWDRINPYSLSEHCVRYLVTAIRKIANITIFSVLRLSQEIFTFPTVLNQSLLFKPSGNIENPIPAKEKYIHPYIQMKKDNWFYMDYMNNPVSSINYKKYIIHSLYEAPLHPCLVKAAQMFLWDSLLEFCNWLSISWA